MHLNLNSAVRGALVGAAALLSLSFSPARAAEPGACRAAPGDAFSGAFDGTRRVLSWRAAACSEAAVPEVEGSAVEASSKGLEEAGRVWGNDAQYARLAAGEPPGPSFTIAVVGDSERGRFPWERVFSPGKDAYQRLLRLAQAGGARLILNLGDFVSMGKERDYSEYVRTLEAELKVPMLTQIGNHDRSRPNGDADKNFFRQVFGKTDFFYDYGGWRFIGVDTADRKLTQAQIEWLKAALDTALRKIVFTHVPPVYLAKRLRTLDVEDDGYMDDVVAGYFTEGSAEFGELVSAAKVDRVYMGHIHAFATAEHNGVKHVLSGGGGSPLYPLPPGYHGRRIAHFILAELGPDGLRDAVVPLSGDRFPVP